MSTGLEIKRKLIKENIGSTSHSSIIETFYRRNLNFKNFIDNLIAKHQCLMNRIQTTRWILGDIKFRKCKVCSKRLDAKASMRENAHFCSMACRKTPLGKKIWNEAKKKALMSKYGVINVGQLKSVKEKSKQTNLQRYGVDNPAKRKEVQEKMRKTTLERYGVKNISQHKELRKKVTLEIQKRGYETVKDNLLKNNLSLNTSFNEYHGIHQNNSKNNIYSLHCNICGLDFDYKFNCAKNLKYACPHCHPFTQSRAEDEIANFIRKVLPDATVLNNYRGLISPQEVDIYIPSHNLAIEFNGLYWHSEDQGKDKRYHLDKTIACEEKGVQLIQIFEDEWRDKQQIVKNRLKHLLNATSYKIYARNCDARNVDFHTAAKFLDKYHLQGATNGSVNLGLYNKNRLVALMTFCRPRFNKKYNWELLRYCTIGNFSIIGGASKLFKYFISNFSGSIISYADRRWSNGKLYNNLEFEQLTSSTPAYYYVKDNIRYNRIKFQKHKLSSILENFNPSLSEYQNMVINGYERVWDCGNLVYGFNN